METADPFDPQAGTNNDPEMVHLSMHRAIVDFSLVLLAIALAKIVVYVWLNVGYSAASGRDLVFWIFRTAWTASMGFDFGIAVFLTHCPFLFSSREANRFIPMALALLYVGVQLIFVSGFLLLPFIAYTISIAVVGWLFQRVLGLCLSLDGASVRLPPLSVGLYVALPALLILIGIVPAGIVTAWVPGINITFSMLTIYFALWLIAGCGIPLAWMYLCLWGVHRRLETKLTLVFIALLVFMLLLGLSSVMPALTFIFNSLLFVSAFSAGLLIMYGCFYKNGFRVVWAKRLALKESEKDVAFDDLV